MVRERSSRGVSDYSLVGLHPDGERAVFYERIRAQMTTVPFDRDGVDGTASNAVERLKVHIDLERFIQEHADLFGWVHPRFRRVTETGMRGF